MRFFPDLAHTLNLSGDVSLGEERRQDTCLAQSHGLERYVNVEQGTKAAVELLKSLTKLAGP